ncbi:MAG: hypothetical protein ACXQTB_02050 [Candidatus Nezhaarchaeales archaeon]
MVVRVKVRVKPRSSHESIDLVVLANGGAESFRPCLVVDEEIARRLKLWPSNEFKIHQVEEASSISEAYVINDTIELELLGDDNEVLARIIADLVIQRGLMEPLITDITIDELGIQVISFSKGLWRHKSDPPDKIRRSS